MSDQQLQPPAGTETPSPAAGTTGAAPSQPSTPARIVRLLSFRNISAIYIFIVMFVIFSIWVPDTFDSWNTWKALIDSQAVTAILAIGIVIPLSAGVFDLAIGAELGVGAILVSWFLINKGVPVIPALILTVLAGALIGLINGLLIVRVKIESFIATLGMSSVLLAVIAWVSGSQQILGLPESFQKLGTSEFLDLTLPVFMMLGIGVVVWYVLERTGLGRRIYATGGNLEAARLAGVKVTFVVVGTLIACAAIASFAGLLVSASLGTGDPTIGPPYLLPAFSAAFLGSTQFRGGRFNVAGTIVAVYVLATGVKGLQLAGAPIWIPDLFNGVALLLAVGLAKYETASGTANAVRRLMRRNRRGKRAPGAPTDQASA
jgi:ribose transport system permease protein